MATVHTAYGPGTIVDRETVRGRTQYKVAGDGFEVWLDEAKIASQLDDPYSSNVVSGGWNDGHHDEHGPIFEEEFPDHPLVENPNLADRYQRSRGRDDEDIDEYQRRMYESRLRRQSGLRDQHPGEDRPQGWFADEEPAGAPRLTSEELLDGARWDDADKRHARLAWAPLDRDNSTTLPYNPEPQHNAIDGPGFDEGSSTIQPIHHIDADERLSPSDSVTFDEEGDGDEPGPNPELFARQGMRHEAVHPSILWTMLPEPAKDRIRKKVGPTAIDTLAGGATGKAVGVGANYIAGEAEQAINSVSPGPGWGDLIKSGSRHEALGPAALAPALLRMIGPSLAGGLLGGDDGGESAGPEGDFSAGEGWGDLVKNGSHRPAGLSDRYIDITASADYHNDPVAQFRHDPDAYINRVGHLMDEGLNPRFAEYMDLVEADSSVRTAAWKDVRQKAMRLKTSGAVHVKDIAPSRIMASVDGDHGTYDVVILKGASYGDQSIANWHCACEWGKWAFRRKFSYVGRLCSHAYASYLTMQSAALKEQRPTRRGPSDMVIKKRQPGDRQYPMPVFAAGKRTADNLQNGPQRLTPDMLVNDTDDAHIFLDVTKDERTDTGPDDVVSDKDIVHFSRLMRHCEVTERPYPRELVAFLSRYSGCADDASDDTQSDYEACDADDANEYLEKIRSDADRKQEEDFGSMAERVHKIQDAVEEARAHGVDADRFVAMVKTAEESSGDPGLDAYREKGGVGYTQNESGNGTYNFNRSQGDGKQRDSGGDPGSKAYAENGGITYTQNADQPGTYSFQRTYPDGEGGSTLTKPGSGFDPDGYPVPAGAPKPGENGFANRNPTFNPDGYPVPAGSPRPGENGFAATSPSSAENSGQNNSSGSQNNSNSNSSQNNSNSNSSQNNSNSNSSQNNSSGSSQNNSSGSADSAPGGGQTSGNVTDGGRAGAENGNNAGITDNEYTVQAGDTLTDIAQRAYGDMNRYQDIANANSIGNVDNLEVGTKIKLDSPTGNNNMTGAETNPLGGGADGDIATPEATTDAVAKPGGETGANPAANPAITTPGSTAEGAGTGTGTAPLAAEAGGTTDTSLVGENTSGSLTDPGLTSPGQKLQSVGRRRRVANPADPNQTPTTDTATQATTPAARPGATPATNPATSTAQPGGSASPTQVGPSKESDTYDPNDPTQNQAPMGTGSNRNDGTQSQPGTQDSGGMGLDFGDGGMGLGDIGGIINQVSDIASPIASGIGDAIGGIASGLGSIFASKADFNDWVRYAYPADGGDDFDPKTMPHIPFAGSGNPGPLEFTTSEEYADKARAKMDDVTDLGDGDLTTPMGDWQKQGSYADDGPYREASVGYSTDDDSDIVRTFQAHMGGGFDAPTGGGRFDDISGAAAGFLRTAGRNYSMAEQSELIREGDKGGARNLDSLDLSGTHYEDMNTLGW